MSEALRPRSMDELTQLSEGDALRLKFDLQSARTLYRVLLLGAITAILTLINFSVDRDPRLIITIVELIFLRVLFVVRDRPWFLQHCRTIVVGALTAEIAFVQMTFFDFRESAHPADFLLTALLLFFRLPLTSLMVPAGWLWASVSGRNLVMSALGQTDIDYPVIVGQTLVIAAVLALADRLGRGQVETFLRQWRRERRRSQERQRMRGEIDDARRIQLSMLPRRDPQIPWLEVAGRSLPASEVGGDYYGYFERKDGRLAIVVADVAGHGLASGLLLSGIRSCLVLLHQGRTWTPTEVIDKLDRMVAQTTDQRTFVTMLYALLDPEERTVTFSAAGHPPLLQIHAANGTVEEHRIDALPMGTRLPSQPQERTVALAPGDVVVLTTDGIVEAIDAHQEVYGDERLARRLQESHGRTATGIRDAVLADLWNFKGDAEQQDDVTLVVAKLR